ncbi:MAG: pyruvate, phosphate dikinase [Gammaproteobacteria bacterium]
MTDLEAAGMTFIAHADAPLPAPPAALASILGGKGASLALMSAGLGLPVPPAFTLTLNAFRRWRGEGGLAFLEAELRAAIARMERTLGRGFGARSRPLVVSVRSGAPVSMPGMMDTILDLGLNDETEAGLAAEIGAATAADAHRRFREMFARIVGTPPPAEPWSQLRMAIEAVFASWDGERARTYRRRAGIADDLGTAATVQAMVFGNAPGFSGTGVAFTRDPSTGEPQPIGDWLANAQGEDVVAGTHGTQPLDALERDAPAIRAELQRVFGVLERQYQDMCDIEFTVESGHLWILQARAGKRSGRAAVRIAVDRALDPGFALTREGAVAAVREADLADALHASVASGADEARRLTTGIAASPGLVCGRVQFTADDAVEAAMQGDAVILVRRETSPDDIHGMDAAVGILTATGGLVSHAAIVAREWGKAAVVGAGALELHDDHLRVGDRIVRRGEPISIDGTTGAVFVGDVAGAATAPDPAAAMLVEWAAAIAGSAGSDPIATLRDAHARLGCDTDSASSRDRTGPGSGRLQP